jgi:hypothetical protein
MTKVSVSVPKAQGAIERLDPQHGEVQHQMRIP